MYTILCILYYVYACYHQQKDETTIITILIEIVKAYIFLGVTMGYYIHIWHGAKLW